jgi:DNA-binding transcriptional ArsR family regulator
MSEIPDILAVVDLGDRDVAVVEKTADAFAALAHPMRRRLLMELRAGPRSASELAADMPIGRPAVAEHLQVLRLAGLVRIERRGRERHYHFDPRPLTDIGSWLNVMLAFWARRLEDIDALSKREAAD